MTHKTRLAALALLALALALSAPSTAQEVPDLEGIQSPARVEVSVLGTCTVYPSGLGGFLVVETDRGDGTSVRMSAPITFPPLPGIDLCDGEKRVRTEGYFAGVGPCTVSPLFPLPYELTLAQRVRKAESLIFADGFETGDTSAWR